MQCKSNWVRIRLAFEKRLAGLLLAFLRIRFFFFFGGSRIKPKKGEVLNEVAKILKQHPDKQIVIEGHTDDLAIKTSKMPSNWELSALRATAVVKYLVMEKGLDPSRFSASGYGEYQPLVPNISEANRRLNRRVDIIITKLD